MRGLKMSDTCANPKYVPDYKWINSRLHEELSELKNQLARKNYEIKKLKSSPNAEDEEAGE